MNPYMWENKATQDNLKTLKQRGVILINPNSGDNGMRRKWYRQTTRNK